MTGLVSRATQAGLALTAVTVAYLSAAGPALADATDDYPIPHRMIITPCEAIHDRPEQPSCRRAASRRGPYSLVLFTGSGRSPPVLRGHRDQCLLRTGRDPLG